MHQKSFGGRLPPGRAEDLTALPSHTAGFRGGKGRRWEGKEKEEEEEVRREEDRDF